MCDTSCSNNMYLGLDAKAAEIYRRFDQTVADYTNNKARIDQDLEVLDANKEGAEEHFAAADQQLTEAKANLDAVINRGDDRAMKLQATQTLEKARQEVLKRRAMVVAAESEKQVATAAKATALATAQDALSRREQEMHKVDLLYAELMATFAPLPAEMMGLSETLQMTFLAIYNVVAAVDGGAYGVTGPSISEGFLSLTRRTTLASDIFSYSSGERVLALTGALPPSASTATGSGMAVPELLRGEEQLRDETHFHNHVFKLVPGWRTAAAVCTALGLAREASQQRVNYGMSPTMEIYDVPYDTALGKAAHLPLHTFLYASTVPGFLDVCFAVMQPAPAAYAERPDHPQFRALVTAAEGAEAAILDNPEDNDRQAAYDDAVWALGGPRQFRNNLDAYKFDPEIDPLLQNIEAENAGRPPPLGSIRFEYRADAAPVVISPRLQFLERFYRINGQAQHPFGLFVNEFCDQVLSALAVGHSRDGIKEQLRILQEATIAEGTCGEYIQFYTNVFLTAITDSPVIENPLGRRWPLNKQLDTMAHNDVQVAWKGTLHALDTDSGPGSASVPDMPITLPLPYAPMSARLNNHTATDRFGYGIGTHIVGADLLKTVEREFAFLPPFTKGIFLYFRWLEQINSWVDGIGDRYNAELERVKRQYKPIPPVDVLGPRCIPGLDSTTRVTSNSRVSLAQERRSYNNGLSICSSPNLWYFRFSTGDADLQGKFKFPVVFNDNFFAYNLQERFDAENGHGGGFPLRRRVPDPNLPDAPARSFPFNSLFLFRGPNVLHSVYEQPVYAAPCALDIELWRTNDENVFRVIEQPTIMSAMRTALATVRKCMATGERQLQLWDICRAGTGSTPLETAVENDDVAVQFAGLVSKLIAITRAHTNGKQRNDWTAMQYLTSAAEDHKRNFTRLHFVADGTADGMHLELAALPSAHRHPWKRSSRDAADDDDDDFYYGENVSYQHHGRAKITSQQRPPVGSQFGHYV